MSANINDITITSLDTVRAFHVVTGAFLYSLEEFQSFSIAQSQDKEDITGKQGRKLGSLKKNKAVKLSGQHGLVSAGLMESQAGCSFEIDKLTTVMFEDYLNVTANQVTLSHAAYGVDGAEIHQAFIRNENGTLGKELFQGAATGDGVFTYDPTTKVMNFEDGEVYTRLDGEPNLVVFYKRQITGHVMENMSDTYSEKATLYIDATGEDTCGRIYHIQFYVPKADFDGNFTLDMGSNQTTHSFEAEALAGSCGTSGSYWTFTIFGDDENE